MKDDTGEENIQSTAFTEQDGQGLILSCYFPDKKRQDKSFKKNWFSKALGFLTMVHRKLIRPNCMKCVIHKVQEGEEFTVKRQEKVVFVQ